MENRYVVYVSMSGMVGTKVCVRTDNKKWNHNFKCVHIIKKKNISFCAFKKVALTKCVNCIYLIMVKLKI